MPQKILGAENNQKIKAYDGGRQNQCGAGYQRRSGGAYSNNLADLSGQIIIPGTTITSTNYLDANGATNSLSRYYRIRVP